MKNIRKILCIALALVLLAGMSASGILNMPANAATTQWKLVTDATELAVGDKIIIAALDADFAMSTTQNSSNRGQAAITRTAADTAEASSDVQIITLEAGNKTDTWAFRVDSGYLYTSGASNQLKTQEALNDNSSWTIDIASQNGTATIKAQCTDDRDWMRYSSTSGLFSCYASGQKDICIYKLHAAEASDSTDEDGSYIQFNKSVVIDDKLYIRYYPAAGAMAEGDYIFGMEYWDHAPTGEADAPTRTFTNADLAYDTAKKRDYFCIGGLKPHEMLNLQYIRMYIVLGDATYYTPVVEFGLAQYLAAYQAIANPDQTVIDVVEAAIAYGEKAAAYAAKYGI